MSRLLAWLASLLRPPAPPLPTPPPPIAGGADPYGFTAWLNATRLYYGLPAVAYDAVLSDWAAKNDAEEVTHGLGHWIMGPGWRQDAGAGYPTAQSVGAAWMKSPDHRAALLDPSITRIGIAEDRGYWTFNAL